METAKIRIGKTFTVNWRLYKREEGQRVPYLLSQDKEYILRLVTPYGIEEVTLYTIKDNEVSWTFLGEDQKYAGCHSLELVEDMGNVGQMTVDTCAFILVPFSRDENLDGSSDVGVDAVSIEGEVGVAPMVSLSIDTELSGTSLNAVANAVVTKEIGDLAKANAVVTKEIGDLAKANAEVAEELQELAEETRSQMDELQQFIGTQVIPSLDRKADLDNGKIVAAQLPDYILGQVMYGGIIYEDTRVLPSLDFTKKYPEESERIMNEGLHANDHIKFTGCYFIVGGETVNATLFGNEVSTGDWIISTRTGWAKVDNTDAVVSVAGLVGHVETSALAEALGLPALIRRIVELEKKLAQGAKKEITFTVADYKGEDRTFTAEEGMTWVEFCASEYNTEGWEVDGLGVWLYTEEAIWFPAIYYLDDNSETLAIGDKTIVPNYRYTMWKDGGFGGGE